MDCVTVSDRQNQRKEPAFAPEAVETEGLLTAADKSAGRSKPETEPE